ncbi:MAG: HAMP domain-containing histidine kinase [Phycisphaeraceae bacterium]|nr:MAG: HAMP domain-containing histidine kinase [Phycisphaeraceae bacterium]
MPGRRWLTWLIYGLCALLVIDVLAWATWRVLGLERDKREATAQADTAQRERLALWQMDSLVSALIARESARPYFEYRPKYAADLPYDRAWRVDDSHAVAASPLAAGTGDPIIRLHYQVEPSGRVVSPQVDPDAVTPGTEDLRARRLVRELSMNSSFEAETREPATTDTLLLDFDPEKPGGTTYERLAGEAAGATTPGQAANETRADSPTDQDGPSRRSGGESAEAQAAPMPALKPQPEPDLSDAGLRQQLFDIARSGRAPAKPEERRAGVEVGVFQPRWLFDPGHETLLVFERPVEVGSALYRQGMWVDWPALRAELLAVAVRLLPDARLEPVARVTGPSSRTLATIPLRLETAVTPVVVLGWTPTRLTIVVTWIAAITALTAIGLVLRAAMRLADRRGRFVTAVTHELRSPLTSFRLSTDLLARTDDETKRRQHIESLQRESRRLAAVVENVLAYAGLRQRREAGPVRALGELLEPLLPAFEQRCREAGASFEVDVEGHGDAAVRVSPGSIERILANLIDNACRYGAGRADAVVRLSAFRAGESARLRVADDGPGVPPGERDRIFGDFFRGEASTRSHSGMGLGLALARGLARAEGGDLRLVKADGPGAVFELSLPAADSPARDSARG